MKSNKANLKKVLKEQYKQSIESFKDGVKEICEEVKEIPSEWLSDKEIPSEWLSDVDEFIELVANMPVEECLQLSAMALDALKFILKTDDPLGAWRIEKGNAKQAVIYDWRILVKLANEDDYSEIERLNNESDNLTLALGYSAMYVISYFRLESLLAENPETKNVLYMFYANELEKDPKSRPYIEKALEALTEDSKNIYKRRVYRKKKNPKNPYLSSIQT